ncbi:MAG: amidohydrolase family protein, partial [Acidobacteria bacterium]|nr:amidohydrolase family protein [Acidobacteriota bacterium]
MRFLVSLIVFGLTVAGPIIPRGQTQQAAPAPEVLHYADMVLYNGKILTADEKFSAVEAVAIRDGKFLAVDTTDRILTMAGPATRKIDLKGKTALPGLVDTHMHPFTEGLSEYYAHKYLGVPLRPINSMEEDAKLAKASVDEILDMVQKAVARAKPGEAVIIPAGSGVGGYGVCRKITLEQLDSVSPNNPVYFLSIVNVWVDGLNSKGASLLHLPERVSPFFVSGLPCASDAAREQGGSTIHWLTPLEELLPAYRAGARRTNEWGITTAKEHTTPVLMAGIRELWVRGELTVRMRMPFPLWPWTGNQTNIPPDRAEDFFRRLGNLSGLGDDMWRLNCVRPEAVGGSLTAGSAWTIDPKLHELPGLPNRPYGAPTWYEEKVEGLKKESFVGRESLVQAVRYGWDVAADHTIGDRAVEEVLKAMEEGLKTQVVKRPGQILAMGHTPMAKPEHLQKMKELGIRAGIGPYHVFTQYKIDAAFTQYGTERINQMA